MTKADPIRSKPDDGTISSGDYFKKFIVGGFRDMLGPLISKQGCVYKDDPYQKELLCLVIAAKNIEDGDVFYTLGVDPMTGDLYYVIRAWGVNEEGKALNVVVVFDYTKHPGKST